MSATTTVDEVTETESTNEDGEQAVEAPEAPLTAAQQAYSEWTDLSPRLFRQDQSLIAWLEANGQGTEKDIRTALPQLSSWSFRRLATGVHHKRTRGDAIIEKVKVDGVTVWQLTEQFRPKAEQPVEEPTEEPTEAPVQNGRNRRNRSGS
jgi:hypothetical protein